MRAMLWVVLGAAVLGLVSTFVIEASYNARAQRVQVVRIDPTQHSPYGPVTVDVGDPMMLIVDDDKAFLKNKTATGLAMLDAGYLKAHGDAALQLRTVESMTALARIGCALSAIVTAAGLALFKRFHAILVPPEP